MIQGNIRVEGSVQDSQIDIQDSGSVLASGDVQRSWINIRAEGIVQLKNVERSTIMAKHLVVGNVTGSQLVCENIKKMGKIVPASQLSKHPWKVN